MISAQLRLKLNAEQSKEKKSKYYHQNTCYKGLSTLLAQVQADNTSENVVNKV